MSLRCIKEYYNDVASLENIPAAWNYKLGNRLVLEWVLDRYKGKKPRDPTSREKFDTHHFADYKEDVIVLLQKVCTISLVTADITQKMGKVERLT